MTSGKWALINFERKYWRTYVFDANFILLYDSNGPEHFRVYFLTQGLI